MMRFSFLLSLLAVCVFQTGCANVKLSLKTHKRIGVVSVIPNKLETKYIGVWAFSNKSGEADVPEANFTGVTKNAVEAQLRSAGFDVVSVEQNSASLIAKHSARNSSMVKYFADNRVGDTERKSIGDELKQYAAKYSLNTLAVIIPAPPRSNSEANVGVGNYGFGTVTLRDDEAVSPYALTSIVFFDAPTLRMLTFRMARKVSPPLTVPFQKDFRAYSAEQQRTLIEAMHAAFKEGAGHLSRSLAKP